MDSSRIFFIDRNIETGDPKYRGTFFTDQNIENDSKYRGTFFTDQNIENDSKYRGTFFTRFNRNNYPFATELTPFFDENTIDDFLRQKIKEWSADKIISHISCVKTHDNRREDFTGYV